MQQWVYRFSSELTEGNKDMKNLLGGKGANLAEMSSLGLAVPPGFTISTEACTQYYKENKTINEEIKKQILAALNQVEKLQKKKFGDKTDPLLFSVRSGSRVSMPGMMDTVLNLGLNDETVKALAEKTKNERFAWDSYRRFIQMFSNVVLGLGHSLLEHQLDDLKTARGVKEDTELNAKDFQELVTVYKSIVLEELGRKFPSDPMEQLWLAIGAVFNSWHNPRAQMYREMHGYDSSWGTAVNVQAMVFGNMGETCATGVCFTRDPSTGAKIFFGEYLVNAQGEDVVAGIRTPAPINEKSKNESNKNMKTLEEIMPETYEELVATYKKLEAHYKDMQDIEFTIENKKLYLLQTRNAKRTVNAALKVAVDLVSEGMITKEQAVLKIYPEDLNQLLHPRLDPKAKKTLLASGLPASPGAAGGQIVFNSETAQEWAKNGKKVILVRQETSPEDIGGMAAAQGILTARGGMTSHAAVVARGMGKPCVAGCSALMINYNDKTMSFGKDKYREGDYLTFDGATGEIYEGLIPTIEAQMSEDFATYMAWTDKFKRLDIRTNADTPEDSKIARSFGAQGIGLCRTEHMFFAPERILAVREMIFAKTQVDRKKALNKLLPFQREDFVGIFKAMNGLPVNIRLLDPPLHEFLPHTENDMKELAASLQISMNEIRERKDFLHEFNPMLGHRGCRLGITFSEIYQMQVRAIIEAALMAKKDKVVVLPEIMIPLISDHKELELLKKEAIEEIEMVFKELGNKIEYQIGTMIELPRAAITADKIAKHAEFFSFGTNDLTQTTYGLSRDDAGKFLPIYTSKNIYARDPFVVLDQEGVGFLVEHAVKIGKKANPDLHCGICGEHGGEPNSIEFCHKVGLDYVSCSPFRVPIARLAAAQAALKWPATAMEKHGSVKENRI
ncbi:MAG: pyruvate, phosphate dikinase [Bacteriovoracaceae bacterium]|nr:pyruvate, phosphate dikinase [Bacteriovoracaceae bacterium]